MKCLWWLFPQSRVSQLVFPLPGAGLAHCINLGWCFASFSARGWALGCTWVVATHSHSGAFKLGDYRSWVNELLELPGSHQNLKSMQGMQTGSLHAHRPSHWTIEEQTAFLSAGRGRLVYVAATAGGKWKQSCRSPLRFKVPPSVCTHSGLRLRTQVITAEQLTCPGIPRDRVIPYLCHGNSIQTE